MDGQGWGDCPHPTFPQWFVVTNLKWTTLNQRVTTVYEFSLLRDSFWSWKSLGNSRCCLTVWPGDNLVSARVCAWVTLVYRSHLQHPSHRCLWRTTASSSYQGGSRGAWVTPGVRWLWRIVNGWHVTAPAGALVANWHSVWLKISGSVFSCKQHCRRSYWSKSSQVKFITTSRLHKFWMAQDIKYVFTAELTETEDRSECDIEDYY